MPTSSPTTFAELILGLGGDRTVAELLGRERDFVKAMRQRDSVAPEHWPALETAAADAGLCVDASDFARWRAGKAQARRAEAAEAN